MSTVKPIVGRRGARKLRPYVEIELDEWLTPARARLLARRIVAAATRAENKYREHLDVERKWKDGVL